MTSPSDRQQAGTTTTRHGLAPHHQFALGGMATGFSALGFTALGATTADFLGAVVLGMLTAISIGASFVTKPPKPTKSPKVPRLTPQQREIIGEFNADW